MISRFGSWSTGSKSGLKIGSPTRQVCKCDTTFIKISILQSHQPLRALGEGIGCGKLHTLLCAKSRDSLR